MFKLLQSTEDDMYWGIDFNHLYVPQLNLSLIIQVIAAIILSPSIRDYNRRLGSYCWDSHSMFYVEDLSAILRDFGYPS